jgi:hypothetical protein
MSGHTMTEKLVYFRSEFVEKGIITLSCDRPGIPSVDVFQELDFIKFSAKVLHILDCLLKTPPPVLVFCEFKNELAELQNYLQLKGVAAAALTFEQSKRSSRRSSSSSSCGSYAYVFFFSISKQLKNNRLQSYRISRMKNIRC